MDLSTVFAVCNFGVLPFWVLLAVAPRSRAAALLVHSPLLPVVLGVVYGAALFGTPPGPEGANMLSLEGVAALFRLPSVVLAGWVHYLIFDLFIGAWQVRDARRRGIHHGLVVPCLVGTLMFGPLGLLAYLTLRAAMKRVGTLAELEPAATSS